MNSIKISELTNDKFIIKMFELILIEINKINKTNKKTKRVYKITYSNEYYLIMIYYMLNNVNQWSFLKELKLYKLTFANHYKTIYNKFRLWTSLNVFKNAFENYKQNLITTNLLLIDATSINNKYGSENIVINVEYKKKKITKLSLLTNPNGFIKSIIPFDIKTIMPSYSTSEHDVKMIKKNLINVKNGNNNKGNYYILLADKAYKTQEKFTLNDKPIKIITPSKKNAIKKNNKKENKKLKKRTMVENVNMEIKKYERILVRKDRKLKYFMAFVHIVSLINNIKLTI